MAALTDYSVWNQPEHLLEEFAAIVASSDDAIIGKTIDGIITSWNPAAEKIFGYSASEAIGQPMTMLFPPNRLAEEADFLSRLVRGERITRYETVRIRKDGSEVDVSVTLSPIRDQSGRVVGASKIAHDISERKRFEHSLRLYAAIVESSEDALIGETIDGTITSWNPAAERMFGYSAAEAIGQPMTMLYPSDHLGEEMDFLSRLVLGEKIARYETVRIRKDGSAVDVSVSLFPIKDDPGQVFDASGILHDISTPDDALRNTRFVAAQSDITERKAAEATIRHLAFYDPLTELPNRRLLLDRLKRALVSSERTGCDGALLFIDLDKFKSLNDTLGHDKGDLLLQQVAQRLNSCVRAGDIVGRLGGDEFVVVLENLSEKMHKAADQAVAVGENILRVIGRPYRLSDRAYRITASIGVAMFKTNPVSVVELLKKADIAMFEAKIAGRNSIRFFDPKLQIALAARAELEAELHRAVLENQFILHYQPQLDGDNRVTGAEALIRWQHPRLGLIFPNQFMSLSEESGHIQAVGNWVLTAACNQIVSWAARPETENLTLAVNISAAEFLQPAFAEQVLSIIRSAAIDPRKLRLELTESVLLENIQDVIDKMQLIKEEGIVFTLDDFGTGYSSLSYLKMLPLSQLKVDQSFIHDILTDANHAAIARTIVALANSLSLTVIAEGVETENQRAFLAELGCPAYQGYLYSRAVQIDEFDRLVMASDRAARDRLWRSRAQPVPDAGRLNRPI